METRWKGIEVEVRQDLHRHALQVTMRRGQFQTNISLDSLHLRSMSSPHALNDMLDAVMERGKRQLEEEEAKMPSFTYEGRMYSIPRTPQKVHWSKISDVDSWGDPPLPERHLLDSLRDEINGWHGNILKG